jgi:uncharacterized protein (TIGR04255 family)
MGVKMSNPPIVYIVAQVQFSPVLDMRKYVPIIQEELRKDFPDFREESINNFQVQLENAVPKPFITQVPRWQFGRADKMSGFLLRTDVLNFHTTAYDTFESFLENTMRGIDVVNKAASLGLVESTAIRTLDAVIPEEGSSVQRYLNPAACGLSEALDGELKQSIVECLRDFPPDGVLISRVAIVKGALGVPADLYPLTLELKPAFRNLNSWHAILDNDRQQKSRFEFNLNTIQKSLTDVKKGVSEAFLKSVSDFAIERWR